MFRDPIEMRIEIMKYIYRLTDMTPNKNVTVFPDQINGYFYSDMKHELQILKEKGLLGFTGNFINRNFRISLTYEGVRYMEEGYKILSLTEEIKKQALIDHFSALKI